MAFGSGPQLGLRASPYHMNTTTPHPAPDYNVAVLSLGFTWKCSLEMQIFALQIFIEKPEKFMYET